MSPSDASPAPLTGRHVLIGMLVFFAIVLSANAALVYVARSSFNGLTEEQAYEKGLAWNAALDQAKAQREAGWKADLALAPGGKTLEITLSDKNGPVDDAQGEVMFYRPVESGSDRTVPLEKVGRPGQYRAAAALPHPGLWEVRVHVRRNGQSFDTAQRMRFPE